MLPTLLDLAAAAASAIERRLARGEDVETVVADVVRTIFAGEAADRGEDEFVADAATVDRITLAVLDIVRGE